MMKKKLLCTALVLGVGLFLLGGCSSSATNSGTPDSSQPEAPPAASSAPDERNATLILQVQSIEGDKVTGLAGTLSELAMEQRPQNRPDMPSAPDSGQRGNRQPADGDGPPPDGNERRSFSPQQFAAGTETITFAIDAATVITVEAMPDSTAGSSSDIVTGSVLEVMLNDHNVAISVTVKMTMGNFGGVPQR